MILLASSLDIDSSPPTLTDTSRLARDRERGSYLLTHTSDTHQHQPCLTSS